MRFPLLFGLMSSRTTDSLRAAAVEKFLSCRAPRYTACALLAAAAACAQPRIDNVLIKMAPPGSTSLVGGHMDQIKTTEFYRKLVEQQKLPQVDQFAMETGFDPRRDVRELLMASTAAGAVLVARGHFQINRTQLLANQLLANKHAQLIRHGQCNVWSLGDSGFCILDATLAAAGDLKSLEAALDEWKSGSHTAAQPLLARAKPIDPASQFWGGSTGVAGFLADHMPQKSITITSAGIFTGSSFSPICSWIAVNRPGKGLSVCVIGGPWPPNCESSGAHLIVKSNRPVSPVWSTTGRSSS